MRKYWEEPHVFSFTALVEDVFEESGKMGIVLDGTYFYPEGGGQPADRGTIASLSVLNVQERDHRIVHYVNSVDKCRLQELRKRQPVDCQVDREFRLQNMRLHTSCHLLFGAAKRLFDKVEYAGFNIGEVGSLYLETTSQIRSDDLQEMARMANEIVVEDRPVTVSFVSCSEAAQMKELAYNLNLPEGKVRIINIDGWDLAACSGTHMQRTLEVGPILVVGREAHKKNVTRIDYAVGKRAVQEIARDGKVLADAAQFLSTSKDQVSQVIRKLSMDLHENQKELRKVRERLIEYKAKDLMEHGEIVNGIRVIVDVVEYLDANSMRALVTKLLADSHSLLVAVIGGSGDLSVTAGCSQDLDLVVSQPIANIAKRYGGGGGG